MLRIVVAVAPPVYCVRPDGEPRARPARLRADDAADADADIRFKLLAFVPTIAGASVGLVGRGAGAAELLAVGLLGLFATLGILLYELGNSQAYDELVERASELEQQLGLGLFSRRRRTRMTLFGLIATRHDRGLGLVYGAALAGWSYLVVWGGLRALDLGGARQAGAVVGVLVGAAVAVEIERLGQTARPS